MTILATKCNSQVECKDGTDEKACAIPSWVLYTISGSFLFFSLLISIITLHCSEVKKIEVVSDVDIKDSSDKDVEALVSQKGCQRKEACQVLYDRKMDEHNGHQGKALNALKVSFRSIEFKTFLKVFCSFFIHIMKA